MKTLYWIGKIRVISWFIALSLFTATHVTAATNTTDHDPLDWCAYSSLFGVQLNKLITESDFTPKEAFEDARTLYEIIREKQKMSDNATFEVLGTLVHLPGPVTYTYLMDLERIIRTVYRHPNRTDVETFNSLYRFCTCDNEYCPN